MLCLVTFLLFVASVRPHASDVWPFKIADQYVEEFQSNVEDLKTSAYSFRKTEENLKARFEFGEEHFEEALKHALHYDFIVVGGGTSGSVIASRLSEIPEWKVLLLEAGNVENQATRVPQNWETLRNTPFNWAYHTTPQNYSCLAMEGHKCTIPAGKVLGGTSAINNMVYTRGNPHDYDVWADLGNKGWCWDDLLPIFKKIEDSYVVPFDKKFHHRGGKQHLENPQYLTHLAECVVKAGEELDVHSVDYNGKKQLGLGTPQLSTDCGRRLSTADAYLKPALKRDNLVIKPLSQVWKVLISTHTKEAQGVAYFHDGKLFVAKADKEVVLSAGALNTPKILMLSGVAPKEECERLHINLVADLKVGHNLKVRPTFVGLDLVYKEATLEKSTKDEYLNYLKHGKGPLTSPGVEAVAFLKTGVTKTSNYPDIELQFQTKYGTDYNEYNWMKLSHEHYTSVWKPLEHHPFVKILVTLNHPKSQGLLKLHTVNPHHAPIIEPHLLSDEDEIDYHTILAGIDKALKFANAKSFHDLGLGINHNAVHGCEELEFGSHDYWECAVKYLVVPSGDVTGTARMGPHSDDEAVVDNKLQVYGVHKLRVADASVIPVTITGNLMAPEIVIGEKAAHLIIEEHVI